MPRHNNSNPRAQNPDNSQKTGPDLNLAGNDENGIGVGPLDPIRIIDLGNGRFPDGAAIVDESILLRQTRCLSGPRRTPLASRISCHRMFSLQRVGGLNP